MRTTLGLLVALGLVGTLAGGCGPKVDCGKLDDKLMKCTKEVMFRLRPDAEKSIKKATDPEIKKQNAAQLAKDIARNQETFKQQITEQCKKHKGRAADAKLINACLKKEACGEFAACIAVYLKEKSK